MIFYVFMYFLNNIDLLYFMLINCAEYLIISIDVQYLELMYSNFRKGTPSTVYCIDNAVHWEVTVFFTLLIKHSLLNKTNRDFS